MVKVMRKTSFLVLGFIFILLFSVNVFGQEAVGMENMGGILESINFLNIVTIYGEYALLIDFILFLLLFIGGVLTYVPSKEGGSKLFPIVIGIVLAILAGVGEVIMDFRLGNLWYVAIIVIAVIIFTNVYRLIQGGEKSVTGASIGIIVIYAAALPFLLKNEALRKFVFGTGIGRAAFGVFSFLAAWALVMLIKNGISGLSGGGGAEGGGFWNKVRARWGGGEGTGGGGGGGWFRRRAKGMSVAEHITEEMESFEDAEIWDIDKEIRGLKKVQELIKSCGRNKNSMGDLVKQIEGVRSKGLDFGKRYSGIKVRLGKIKDELGNLMKGKGAKAKEKAIENYLVSVERQIGAEQGKIKEWEEAFIAAFKQMVAGLKEGNHKQAYLHAGMAIEAKEDQKKECRALSHLTKIMEVYERKELMELYRAIQTNE